MPVARYFLFVGGLLLALLFALDASPPQQTAVAGNAAPSINKTVVRILSDQKLPERVVYDTSLTTIVPPAVATQIAAAPAAPAADVGAQAQVRDTFASSSRRGQEFEKQPESKPGASARSPRSVRLCRCASPATALWIGFSGTNTW